MLAAEAARETMPIPGTADIGAVPLSDVPPAMRQVADYFLLKTKRTGITPGELSALRVLDEIHTPARINAEITTAVKRFEKNVNPLEKLTLEYIYESLKYQVSRKEKKPAKNSGQFLTDFDIENMTFDEIAMIGFNPDGMEGFRNALDSLDEYDKHGNEGWADEAPPTLLEQQGGGRDGAGESR
jgi:hypothetical protein